MDNPGLLEDLWEHFDGRLWHATARDDLHGIIADEEIRVAVRDRYAGSFSRNLGGVSLFDFGPASEDVPNQFHNWCGWFGHQQEARVAVWLEIDRASVLESLMDAKVAREASKQNLSATFIPGVEAGTADVGAGTVDVGAGTAGSTDRTRMNSGATKVRPSRDEEAPAAGALRARAGGTPAVPADGLRPEESPTTSNHLPFLPRVCYPARASEVLGSANRGPRRPPQLQETALVVVLSPLHSSDPAASGEQVAIQIPDSKDRAKWAAVPYNTSYLKSWVGVR